MKQLYYDSPQVIETINKFRDENLKGIEFGLETLSFCNDLIEYLGQKDIVVNYIIGRFKNCSNGEGIVLHNSWCRKSPFECINYAYLIADVTYKCAVSCQLECFYVTIPPR